MDLNTCGCLTGVRTIAAGSGDAFQVGFGGTFDIAANQTNRLYSGSFPVMAEYQ